MDEMPFIEKCFRGVIKKKGYNIRQISLLNDPDKPSKKIINEKTIRRCFEKKRIKTEKLEKIAEVLDVEPNYLAGRYELMMRFDNDVDKYLTLIDLYPFARRDFEGYKEWDPDKRLGAFLSTFNVSIDQLRKLSIEQQYDFIQALLESTSELIKKSFERDMDGDPNMRKMERLITSHLFWDEDQECMLSADTVLRDYYVNNPPLGVSPEDIKNMTPEEIFDMHIDEQEKRIDRHSDSNKLKDEYDSIPLIED